MLSQLINTNQQTTVHLDAIRRDGGTQPRHGLNAAYVAELAAALEEGAQLPPVDVMHDGQNYWLFDGFHRVAAHRQANILLVPATIHQGDQHAAQWRSYAANQTHGLRRTNDDKQRAITAALRHPNAITLSDREIARHLGVDHKTVASYREKLQSTGEIPQSTHRTGADGRTIDTTNIGAKTVTVPAPVLHIHDDGLFQIAESTMSADTLAGYGRKQPYLRGMFRHDARNWVAVGIHDGIACLRVHTTTEDIAPGETASPYIKDAYRGRHVTYRNQELILGAQWLVVKPLQQPKITPPPSAVEIRNTIDTLAWEAAPVTDAVLIAQLQTPAAPPPPASDFPAPAAPRRLDPDDACTALLGQAIVDAYIHNGALRLTLDNAQLLTINGVGLSYVIEEA